MNYAYWIDHFRRNRENRPEPPWNAPLTMPAWKVNALRPSIVQFQLGDGGGECRLIARDAGRFRERTAEATTVVDLWFKEEAEHSRLLACAVDRLGGRRIHSHWSYEAFCFCRRALGVRFELQVLTITELVSTGYYRVLQRHCHDEALAQMCGLILRDEGGHVAFQRARLAADGISSSGWRGVLWKMQFWLSGLAAASVLWSSHGKSLKPLGASTREFYSEVRLEIGRFIRALA